MIEYIIGLSEITNEQRQDISLIEDVVLGENKDKVKALFKELRELGHFEDGHFTERKEEILKEIKDLVKSDNQEIKQFLFNYDDCKVIDYGYMQEIVGEKTIRTQEHSEHGYYEGWETFNFPNEVSEVLSVQVCAKDVHGFAEREGATYADVTNSSINLGVFSNTEQDVTVSYSIKVL